MALMVELSTLWSEVLPEVKKGVTGVGVWTALNGCQPVALEGSVLVLGVPYELGELSGHLKVPQTRRLLDQISSQKAGVPLSVRIIDGVLPEDWELVKRKDAEAL